VIVDVPGSPAAAEATLEKLGRFDDALARMSSSANASRPIRKPPVSLLRLAELTEPARAREACAKVPPGTSRYGDAQKKLSRRP